MKEDVTIYVVYGGVSDEREVSLVSGKAVAEGVSHFFKTIPIDLQERAIPNEVNKEKGVVFPVLHGEFGEDGEFQALLEAQGIEFVGCGSISSALCMDKSTTKKRIAANGVHCPGSICFEVTNKPSVESVFEQLGSDLIIKPNNKGSTIGFSFIKDKVHLENLLKNIATGEWLIEKKVTGRELTVGLLNGKAMGVVEIRPKSGVYDYHSKYTPGTTEYLFPAPLPEAIERQAKEAAEVAFQVCGCRDYARADFIFSNDGGVYFLELNSIPGFTPTSLLPKSASCVGLEFRELCKAIVEQALERFYTKRPIQAA